MFVTPCTPLPIWEVPITPGTEPRELPWTLASHSGLTATLSSRLSFRLSVGDDLIVPPKSGSRLLPCRVTKTVAKSLNCGVDALVPYLEDTETGSSRHEQRVLILEAADGARRKMSTPCS